MKYPRKLSAIHFYITAILISFIINIQPAFSINTSVPAGFMNLDSSVEDLRKTINKAFPGIVMIIVYDIAGEESARGCGFFYDSEGRIITNARILKNAYSAKVIGQSRVFNNVSILDYDETIDAAMIKVNANDVIPLVMDFEGNIAIDDKVIAIGMSENYNKTVSEGIVSSVKTIDESRILIHGRTVAPLFSFPPSDSGPLLNSEGKVIGLTTYAISDNPAFQNKAILFSGKNINAISARSLITITEQHASPTILQPSKSKIWWHWFKHRIKIIALSAFLTFYTLGITTLLKYVVLLLIFISILQWIYKLSKKKIRNFNLKS